MNSVNKSALVPYTAEQMFDLVADIERYPQFLQWCSGASVISEQDGEVVARLEVAYKGIKQAFTTQNVNSQCDSIHMNLQDTNGPFRDLNGVWTFTKLGKSQEACKVQLELDFSFKNYLLRQMMGPVFSQIANSQLDAFVQRAAVIYAGVEL